MPKPQAAGSRGSPSPSPMETGGVPAVQVPEQGTQPAAGAQGVEQIPAGMRLLDAIASDSIDVSRAEVAATLQRPWPSSLDGTEAAELRGHDAHGVPLAFQIGPGHVEGPPPIPVMPKMQSYPTPRSPTEEEAVRQQYAHDRQMWQDR